MIRFYCDSCGVAHEKTNLVTVGSIRNPKSFEFIPSEESTPEYFDISCKGPGKHYDFCLSCLICILVKEENKDD